MRFAAPLFVLVASLAGCGDDDEAVPTSAPTASPSIESETSRPATGGTAPSAPATTVGVRPEGFTQIAAEVTLADGSACPLCLWLADESEERQRGLMYVTDLGGADGMAFVYEDPSNSAFWMGNTVMPLSIAFFAADGTFVSAADMTPCLTGADAACVRYPSAGEFTTAVEMPLGRLDELGIGEGSRIELGEQVGSCPLT